MKWWMLQYCGMAKEVAGGGISNDAGGGTFST